MFSKAAKKTLLILTFVAICVFSYIVYLGISLDGVYVKRGSFGYYLTIHSSLIKNFPLPEKINDEKFTNRTEDGQGETCSIIYQTNADKDSLVRTFEGYLLNNGYRKDERLSSNSELFYENSSSSYVRILFETISEGAYKVTIEQSY
jgi:hypothetical protein